MDSDHHNHNIFRDSVAWHRLQQGIPREITDEHLRQMFHDYATLVTVMAAYINNLLDEDKRLHQRIDHRRDEHDGLRDELFKPKEGLLAVIDKEQKEYTDRKTGIMTTVQIGVLAAIAGSAIMFAIMERAG